ncbi:MAG: MarR family transcriptional regulator [Pseudomonadota bacterium]
MLRSLSHSLPIQLLAVHDLVMRYFRPMLNRFDMTDQQWRVLRVIAAEGEADFRVIAETCLIHPASLSRMLETLEARGWVTRRTHPNDRRQRLIKLAPEGQSIFDRASAETETIHRALEADLGASHGSLVRLLGDAKTKLAAQSVEPAE